VGIPGGLLANNWPPRETKSAVSNPSVNQFVDVGEHHARFVKGDFKPRPRDQNVLQTGMSCALLVEGSRVHPRANGLDP
jgi:hypothetical protein